MQNEIRQDRILGSRRFSNYFWATILFIGGFGFLLAGISTYYRTNLLPFGTIDNLVFIPQGIGSKPIGGGISELRGRHEGRVYYRKFRKPNETLFEILGKSNKQNQKKVIALLTEIYL